MRTNTLVRTLVIAGALVLGDAVTGAALGAQRAGSSTFVVGVADADTGEPLVGTEVILLGVHRLARANALGEATIDDVPRGPQHVRVRRLGYAPAEVDVAIVGDTTGAVFRLLKSVVQLGAVNVEAEWTPPRMKDVEMRRRQGIGRFLTDTDLQRDRDRDFALVLTTRFPGLMTILDKSGNRVLASTSDVKPCVVTVYLDDIERPRDDMDLIRTWDLAAVEYYSSTEVPVRYRTKAYGCGVLLLWSKWY